MYVSSSVNIDAPKPNDRQQQQQQQQLLLLLQDTVWGPACLQASRAPLA